MTTSRTVPVGRALAALAAALSAVMLVSTASLAASVGTLPNIDVEAAAPATDTRTSAGEESRTSSGPSAQGAAQRRSTPVPILMYHVIGDPRPGTAPYPELFVRATDFASQMRWLARHGYHPVTLRAVWDHWHRGAPLPSKPIVVSFDDGYRSVAHAALPAMRRWHWPGVLNLAVKNLHVPGGLSERQVHRLIGAGWELGAHTLTHPDLTALSPRELDREVAGSRRALQRRFGVPVEFFCYPSGRYDARVVDAVRRAGFLGATTTVEGLATPVRPYELRRVRVNRTDGVAGLAEKLVSGS